MLFQYAEFFSRNILCRSKVFHPGQNVSAGNEKSRTTVPRNSYSKIQISHRLVYLINHNLDNLKSNYKEHNVTIKAKKINIFSFAFRWQRVVLSWSLSDGLWLYTDSQFRGWTKTPKSVPRDVVSESGDFVVGRKNVEPDTSPAEFSIGSLAIFPRFLEKKDVEKIYSGKS